MFGVQGKELEELGRLLWADGEDAEAVSMHQLLVRVGVSNVLPQSPDAEVTLAVVDVVEQDNAPIAQLGIQASKSCRTASYV